MNNSAQYKPTENIVIGNGLGMHRFSTKQSYTERALRAMCISAKQIAMYFKKK